MFNFPGAKELAAMFEFYQTGNVIRDIKQTKRVNPRVRTFDKWLHDEGEDLENSLKEEDEDT